jgi:predicted nucleotidyltransferase
MDAIEKNRLQNILNIIKTTVNPDKIILFGSRTVETFSKESDFDLLVLKSNISEPRKLSKKIYQNLICVGAPVDILVSSTEKYNELKIDPFLIYSEIDSHGIVVYERH